MRGVRAREGGACVRVCERGSQRERERETQRKKERERKRERERGRLLLCAALLPGWEVFSIERTRRPSATPQRPPLRAAGKTLN